MNNKVTNIDNDLEELYEAIAYLEQELQKARRTIATMVIQRMEGS